jgi:hypothetical protein
MIRACSDCGGRGIVWYLLLDDHALDWGDDCFPWGESALRLCRTCGGRGVLGAYELEATVAELRAELEDRANAEES